MRKEDAIFPFQGKDKLLVFTRIAYSQISKNKIYNHDQRLSWSGFEANSCVYLIELHLISRSMYKMGVTIVNRGKLYVKRAYIAS